MDWLNWAEIWKKSKNVFSKIEKIGFSPLFTQIVIEGEYLSLSIEELVIGDRLIIVLLDMVWNLSSEMD